MDETHRHQMPGDGAPASSPFSGAGWEKLPALLGRRSGSVPVYQPGTNEPAGRGRLAFHIRPGLCGPQTYYWAIVEQASGDVIGEIFVDDFSGRNGWCELDWKVGKAFQGKGYATEAARAVLRYLFGRSASTGFRPSAVWKTRPRSASCSASAWCGKVSCEIFFSAGITAGTTWCCTPRFPQP